MGWVYLNSIMIEPPDDGWGRAFLSFLKSVDPHSWIYFLELSVSQSLYLIANGPWWIPVGWASRFGGSTRPLCNRMWEHAPHHRLSSWGKIRLCRRGKGTGRRSWWRKRWGEPLHYCRWHVKAGNPGSGPDAARCKVVRRKPLVGGGLSESCVAWIPSTQVNLAISLQAAGLSTLAENLCIIIPLVLPQAPGSFPCSYYVLSSRENWSRGSKIVQPLGKLRQWRPTFQILCHLELSRYIDPLDSYIPSLFKITLENHQLSTN